MQTKAKPIIKIKRKMRARRGIVVTLRRARR